jgi:hypothetical protein
MISTLKFKRILVATLLAGLALVVIRSSRTDDAPKSTVPQTLALATTSDVALIPDANQNAVTKNATLENVKAFNESTEVFQQRFSALVNHDPLAAFALAKSLPIGDPQRDTIRTLVCGLVQTNSELAASMVADLSSPLAEQMAAALATAWGKKDLPAAIDWARHLAEGKLRNEVLLTLSADWATLDALDAAEFAHLSLSDEAEIQAQFLSIIGGRWASKDPVDAIAWSLKLPEGDSRETFLAAVSSTMSESFPAEAAQLVASLTPGSRQEDAALTVVLHWVRKNPQAAVEWAQSFPSDSLRLNTLLNLVSTLTIDEPESMQKVLENWPDSPEREQAIDRYTTEILASKTAVTSE